jgi:protein-S-isoprenylcysteine O-methyltransferase Ste14
MNNVKDDNAGVKVPPPLIYLAAMVAGLILNHFFPIAFLPVSVSRVAGVLSIALAVLILVSAFRQFNRAKTNLEPWKPTTAIVSDGVFRFSRNPIYLGFTLFYLGAAFLFNSLWLLALLAPVLFVMRYGVIAREERYLENKFGAEYSDYKRRVRRWM